MYQNDLLNIMLLPPATWINILQTKNEKTIEMMPAWNVHNISKSLH